MPRSLRAIGLNEAAEEAASLPEPMNRVGRNVRVTLEPGLRLILNSPLLLPEEPFRMPEQVTPDVPPLVLCRLENAVFDGASGMVFPTPDTVLFEASTMWPLRINGGALGELNGSSPEQNPDWRPDREAAKPMTGAYAVLGMIRTDYVLNWYHWLTEHLPKLYLLSRVPETARLQVILSAPITEAQRQSLDVLGLDETRCVALPSDFKPVCPEVAYIPGPINVHSAVCPRPVAWMAETAVERMGFRELRSTKLLYVRRGGHRRAVSNENEVVAALTAAGFLCIRPEEMSFAEQVRSYREARVIVSAHGAGLANTAFCQPGTIVVELTSLAHGDRPSLNMIYANLSAIRDLVHVFAIGDSVDGLGNFAMEPAKILRAAMHGLNGAAKRR